MSMVALLSGGPSNPLVSGLGSFADWIAAVAEGTSSMTNLFNSQITSLEATQPEYTSMQLDVRGLVTTINPFGVTVASYDWAPQIASTVNGQYQAGTLRDLSTGEKVLAWSGVSQIAYVVGTGAVRFQWRKGQPFSPWIIVELIAVAAIGWFVYQALRGANWSLSKAVSNITNPGAPGVGQTQFFGVPLWAWLAGGAAAVTVPFGEERLAVWERAHRALAGRR